MPTKMHSRDVSMTLPCRCGRTRRPKRLFGFPDEEADEAPGSPAGLPTPGRWAPVRYRTCRLHAGRQLKHTRDGVRAPLAPSPAGEAGSGPTRPDGTARYSARRRWRLPPRLAGQATQPPNPGCRRRRSAPAACRRWSPPACRRTTVVPERPAGGCAGAAGHEQRHHAEDEGERRHHDRAEPQVARGHRPPRVHPCPARASPRANSTIRMAFLAARPIEQHHADLRVDAVVQSGEEEAG